METTSLADAKNWLSKLVSVVQGTWERVTITKNGKTVTVLMAVEDLESLVETSEISSDPDAVAAVAGDSSGTDELTTGQEMAAILAKRFGAPRRAVRPAAVADSAQGAGRGAARQRRRLGVAVRQWAAARQPASGRQAPAVRD